MSLSSESIQKKEFHIVFKGYKPEEVDKFLDLLAIEFADLLKRGGAKGDHQEYSEKIKERSGDRLYRLLSPV